MERGIYELWLVEGKKRKRLGSFNTLERLQREWSSKADEYHVSLLEARIRSGASSMLANDQMPKINSEWRTDFKSAEERDQYILEHAKHFTIVRFLGVGQYERHERKTLEEAEQLAATLSGDRQGNYMIYAVGPLNLSAFIKSVIYKRGK